MSDVIERAKERLNKNSKSIYIDRLPTPTKHEFTKYAFEDFADDYGLTFKSVWDEWKLLKDFFSIIVNLESRVAALESKDEVPDKKKEIRNKKAIQKCLIKR